MRTIEGRGDWRPASRIESLRRYAFIGDSTVYGSGVAPDKALPAQAERSINELLPAWPVEAVNFGICGYNLWNSWHAFRHGPQVYDGVVLTLCINDAQLLDRTFGPDTSKSNAQLWEPSHPYGPTVMQCFDDIAAFSRQMSLPIAVCYYTIWDVPSERSITEIVSDLCAKRGLPFIDALAHLKERNFPFADLIVSDANHHPSVIAHAAIGRHIGATLRQLGWFDGENAESVALAPDRILASARAMVERDHYPPNAALNWAIAALEVKERVANRIRALGSDIDFDGTLARGALVASQRHWHGVNRARAFLEKATNLGYGFDTALARSEEGALRLEEINVALATGNGNRLLARLLADAAQTDILDQIALSEMSRTVLDRCKTDLARFRETIGGLQRLSTSPPLDWAHTHFDASEEIGFLLRLVDRVQTQLAEFGAAYRRAEQTLTDARAGLPDGVAARGIQLLANGLNDIKNGFAFLPRSTDELTHVSGAEAPLFTTIRITVVGEARERTPNDGISVRVEYGVPRSLAFRDNHNFLYDGEENALLLRVPVFYAGRVIVFFRQREKAQAPNVSLVKIDVFNSPDRHTVVLRSLFHTDSLGRLVSPRVYPI